MDEEIKQNWKERLKEFAIINEMFIRGFPMGKLEAFMEVELDLAVSKERELATDILEREKATWANQSIGYKAVESIQMAFKERLTNLINTK